MMLLLALLACTPEPELAAAVYPVVTGWLADKERVQPGELLTFSLELDWDGQAHDHMFLETHYDRANVDREWDGDHFSTTFAATNVTSISSNAGLRVCHGSMLGRCVEMELDLAQVQVAGGPGWTLVSPVDEVTLVVGERRPVQAATFAGETMDVARLSGDAITYTTDQPDVISVDANGFVTALKPGQAWLKWRTVALQEDIQVTVVDGDLGPPSEGVYRFQNRVRWQDLEYKRIPTTDPRDNFAINPDGIPLVLLKPRLHYAPSVSLPNQPLWLATWTGSGFGYEWVNEYHETTEQPFLGVGIDGHQYVGWVNGWEQGIAIRDRAPDGTTWQQRLLPIRPDLGRTADAEVKGLTFAVEPQIATLPSSTGMWVAYAMSYKVTDMGYPTAAIGQQCTRILRLAHVTPTDITVEDLDIAYQEICAEQHWENWVGLDLAPPEDGSSGPTIVASRGQKIEVGTHRVEVFQKGLDGWVVTDTNGPFQGVGAVGVAASSHPSIDHPARFGGSGTGSGWGFPGPDGSHLFGGATDIDGQRTTAYGYPVGDSMLAPHFPGPYGLDGALGYPLYAVGADAERAFMISERPPSPEADADLDTWMYVSDQPHAVLHTDDELSGTRLWDGETTQRYHQAAVLADGTRVLAGSTYPTAGAAWARSDGPGDPWVDLGSSNQLPGFDPGDDNSHFWAHGDDLFAADMGRLWRSSDAGDSWTELTQLDAVDRLLAAVSVSESVAFRLVKQGSEVVLWRTEEGVGATSLPVMLPDYSLGADPSQNQKVLVDGEEVVVLTYQVLLNPIEKRLVTQRYDADGVLLSENSVVVPGKHVPPFAALTGAGALLVPTATSNAGQLTEIWASTDDGATWHTSPVELEGTGNIAALTPLVTLADGRVALLHNADPHNARQQAQVRTSADGLTWSEAAPLRLHGGRLQQVFAAAPEPDGGLLVHMGDSGTFWSGYPFSYMESLVLRVPSP